MKLNEAVINSIILKNPYRSEYAIIKKLNQGYKPDAKTFADLYDQYYTVRKVMEKEIVDRTGLSSVSEILWRTMDLEPKDAEGKMINEEHSLLQCDAYPYALDISIFNDVYGKTAGPITIDYSVLYKSYSNHVDDYIDDCATMESELGPLISKEVSRLKDAVDAITNKSVYCEERAPLMALEAPYFVFLHDIGNVYYKIYQNYDDLGNVRVCHLGREIALISAYYYCLDNNIYIIGSLLKACLCNNEFKLLYDRMDTDLPIEEFAKVAVKAYNSLSNDEAWSLNLNLDYNTYESKLRTLLNGVSVEDELLSADMITLEHKFVSMVPTDLINECKGNLLIALVEYSRRNPELYEDIQTIVKKGLEEVNM